MSVEFIDNTAKVIAQLDDAAIAFLYEAGGELVKQTQRNVPNDKGGRYYSQQKEKWVYKVDEAKGECVVGNPLESSLWTEFGTGEHSISPKGGRKGYWVYVQDSDKTGATYIYKGGKEYTLKEARQIVAMMRSQNIDAHYTKGQQPKRPLFNAFTKLKPKLVKQGQKVLKARFDE